MRLVCLRSQQLGGGGGGRSGGSLRSCECLLESIVKRDEAVRKNETQWARSSASSPPRWREETAERFSCQSNTNTHALTQGIHTHIHVRARSLDFSAAIETSSGAAVARSFARTVSRGGRTGPGRPSTLACTDARGRRPSNATERHDTRTQNLFFFLCLIFFFF